MKYEDVIKWSSIVFLFFFLAFAWEGASNLAIFSFSISAVLGAYYLFLHKREVEEP